MWRRLNKVRTRVGVKRMFGVVENTDWSKEKVEWSKEYRVK